MDRRAAGYDAGMTAPENPPDERSDADRDEPDTAEPDLKAIGDSHMPEDLRDEVREHAEAERDEVLERAEAERDRSEERTED